MAQTAAPGYEIQLGVAESDNIQRLPSGGSDQTIAFEELGFAWHDRGSWLDSDIDADISHLSYLQHAYTNEAIGNLIGQAQINFAPQLLSWNILENFGQVPLNLLAPITPDNRENINYFSTGPALSLSLARATRLDVTGQFGRVDYQYSPFDDIRLTGSVDLLHELSPISSISIDARDLRVDFSDDQLNPDYDRQEAFVRFDTKGSRTQLGFDLGYSHLHMLGASNSIPFARLHLSRRVSASSTIGVAFGHDYSDGADLFRLVQSLGGATLNTQAIVDSPPPFVSNYATLAWNFQRARTTLDFSASYFRDRYQTVAALDNDRTMVVVRAERRITPVLELALREDAVHEHFTTTSESVTQTGTLLELTWHVGSRLSVIGAYYLAKSSSDIHTDQYTENRLWLAIAYGRAAELAPGPAAPRLPVAQ